jgi:hypothetical protein
LQYFPVVLNSFQDPYLIACAEHDCSRSTANAPAWVLNRVQDDGKISDLQSRPGYVDAD